jgi:D-glycero-D-manno-heptose 1,7-bisphosphate phosphatase
MRITGSVLNNLDGGVLKVVFSDRDGTLTLPPPDRRVDSPEKLELYPDTLDALGYLAAHDFAIIIVTNQTGIAEGRISPDTYDRIERRLLEMLEPSGVQILKTYTCPHSRADGCICRKPKPAMLLDAASEFGINLEDSYMIGDRRDDIDLGINLGVRPILVETGTQVDDASGAIFVAVSLMDAAKYIVANE